MLNEWRNDLPPKEGYYEAKFGVNDTPSVIYLHPFKAGEIAGIDEDFISWGWDESDDPESVEVECKHGDFWWREIQSTQRPPDKGWRRLFWDGSLPQSAGDASPLGGLARKEYHEPDGTYRNF